MRAMLVFLVILAASLPADTRVASGGKRDAGKDATNLVSGDRTVAVSNGSGSRSSDFSRLVREAAKRDENLPILVNTPGRHGFAPQKSQEPDATIVTAGRPYARGVPRGPDGLKSSPKTE